MDPAPLCGPRPDPRRSRQPPAPARGRPVLPRRAARPGADSPPLERGFAILVVTAGAGTLLPRPATRCRSPRRHGARPVGRRAMSARGRDRGDPLPSARRRGRPVSDLLLGIDVGTSPARPRSSTPTGPSAPTARPRPPGSACHRGRARPRRAARRASSRRAGGPARAPGGPCARHRRDGHGRDGRAARRATARRWPRRSPGTTPAAATRRGGSPPTSARAFTARTGLPVTPAVLAAPSSAGYGQPARARRARAGSTSPSGSCAGSAATRWPSCRSPRGPACSTSHEGARTTTPSRGPACPPTLLPELVARRARPPAGPATRSRARRAPSSPSRATTTSVAAVGVGAVAPGDVLDSCGTAEALVRAWPRRPTPTRAGASSRPGRPSAGTWPHGRQALLGGLWSGLAYKRSSTRSASATRTAPSSTRARSPPLPAARPRSSSTCARLRAPAAAPARRRPPRACGGRRSTTVRRRCTRQLAHIDAVAGPRRRLVRHRRLGPRPGRAAAKRAASAPFETAARHSGRRPRRRPPGRHRRRPLREHRRAARAGPAPPERSPR